jgi:DNA polymerase-3 subunit alpha
VPLWVDKDGAVVTQYTFTDVESIGLIKFDFLGLKTLTLISGIVDRIREGRGVSVAVDGLPLDDAATYKLLAAADTIGVFQLESGGIRRLLMQLKPSCFADLVAILALYRPGPLDAKLEDGSTMVDRFIRRKHGKEKVAYLHPALEPILRETYGVIVYQEQVMQIAQALGGYSLGDADNLRRAMGKKKKEVMEEERKRFLEGVGSRGSADAKVAGDIFDQMETFAAYGFNKSHSAAYALITFQTAYLKAHYPTEFMAGLLSLEAGDIDSTYKNMAECRDRGITVLQPDVNESRHDFTARGETIRFGLGAVKGVGAKAIESVIAAREDGGPFVSLHDFCLRIRSQLVNRRVIESLVKCGAFDSVERNRARLMGALDDVMRWAASRAEERSTNQMGLFGAVGGFDTPPPLPEAVAWHADDELRAEREAIGFFITGHPLDRYAQDLRRFTNVTIGTLRTRGPELPPGPGAPRPARPAAARPRGRRHPHGEAPQQQEGRPLRDLRHRGPRGCRRGHRLARHVPEARAHRPQRRAGRDPRRARDLGRALPDHRRGADAAGGGACRFDQPGARPRRPGGGPGPPGDPARGVRGAPGALRCVPASRPRGPQRDGPGAAGFAPCCGERADRECC